MRQRTADPSGNLQELACARRHIHLKRTLIPFVRRFWVRWRGWDSCETPLPDNIRVTLRDWRRQGERIHGIEDAAVLELDDSALLDALLADRAARSWIERRLDATAALIAAGHVAEVRAWLLRHGELPA